MAENKLADLSTEFAVRILKLTDSIKGHYSLSNQLERSGTSIGANIHEAQRAQSIADFTAKMYIALKEAQETEYRLMLLKETDYIDHSTADAAIKDCEELIKMLTATTKKTAERNY